MRFRLLVLGLSTVAERDQHLHLQLAVNGADAGKVVAALVLLHKLEVAVALEAQVAGLAYHPDIAERGVAVDGVFDAPAEFEHCKSLHHRGLLFVEFEFFAGPAVRDGRFQPFRHVRGLFVAGQHRHHRVGPCQAPCGGVTKLSKIMQIHNILST